MQRPKAPTLSDIWRVIAVSPSVEAQAQALAALAPGRNVIFKAIDACLESGKDAGVLERFAEAMGWDLNRAPGARPPKVGERRSYQVQVWKGNCFVRVPVHTLGLQRGDIVDAVFEDGFTTVRPRKRQRRASVT